MSGERDADRRRESVTNCYPREALAEGGRYRIADRGAGVLGHDLPLWQPARQPASQRAAISKCLKP
jgi:hypothetical protein